jgi:hypothetical protein
MRTYTHHVRCVKRLSPAPWSNASAKPGKNSSNWTIS